MCLDDDAFRCIQIKDETVCCAFMYRLFISWDCISCVFEGYFCVFCVSPAHPLVDLRPDQKTSVLSVIVTLQSRL